MLTRKIWVACNTPSDHPLYEQIRNTSRSITIPWYWWLIGIILTPVIFTFILLLSTTAYSALWMFNSINTTITARKSGRYDLLATAPDGEFGVLWQIWMGCSHRNGSFERVYAPYGWLVGILFGMSFTFAFLNVSVPFGLFEYIFFIQVAPYIIVGLSLYIDYFQSVSLACLVTVLVSESARDGFSAGVIGVGGFLIIQMLGYAMVIVAILNLPVFGNVGIVALVVLTPLASGLMHEVMMLILWRRLKKRFAPFPPRTF